jgi:two-component system chemotaxis sensor kinase CheA
MPEDLKDLLVKFAGSQQSVLEDFEAYILELEKGNPEAKGAIKRVLHTWKGEFGVLDLRDYSKLIHEFEDHFEAGRTTAEHLFKFKDFLQAALTKATSGAIPPLTGSDSAELLPSTNAAEAQQKPDAPPPKTNVNALPSSSAVKPGPAEKNAPPTTYQMSADPSLLADFVHESRDHIHTAETVLLELETDPSNAENINSVFRAWHTIKGVAGFLGLAEISKLAHSMENLMDKARKQELVLNAEYIDLLL